MGFVNAKIVHRARFVVCTCLANLCGIIFTGSKSDFDTFRTKHLGQDGWSDAASSDPFPLFVDFTQQASHLCIHFSGCPVKSPGAQIFCGAEASRHQNGVQFICGHLSHRANGSSCESSRLNKDGSSTFFRRPCLVIDHMELVFIRCDKDDICILPIFGDIELTVIGYKRIKVREGKLLILPARLWMIMHDVGTGSGTTITLAF